MEAPDMKRLPVRDCLPESMLQWKLREEIL